MEDERIRPWVMGVSLALGNAPVEDINAMNVSQGAPQTQAQTTQPITQMQATPQMVPTANLSEAQRLTRLEQQQNNLANMNLPQQIAHLQQELAQLRGEIQVQQHDLKMLSNQQRSFYQDLDQRLAKLKKNGLA